MFHIKNECNQSQIYRTNSQSCFFNKESFHIVSGSISYLKELVSISKQTYIETYPDYFEQDELEELFCEKAIAEQVNDKNTIFLIAKYADQYIGYAKIITKDSVATLDKLYFVKQFQGKGYGKQLLNACLKNVDNLGINYIMLYVHDENTQAINFYMKNGFFLQEKKIPYFRPDGSETTDYNFLMECIDIKAYLTPEKTSQLYV